MKWLSIVFPVLAGGLAGTLISVAFNISKQRLELSLRIVREFFEIYHEIGEARGSLGSAALSRADANNIRKVGDWMETVSYLYAKRQVKRKVLKELGIIEQIGVFYGELCKATPEIIAYAQDLSFTKRLLR